MATTMLRVVGALLGLAIAGILYLYLKLVQRRDTIKGLPQPPMPNKLLGHLYVAEECQRLFPPGIHPHVWPHFMQKKYNLGPVFYVDWWPVGPSWIYVSDPEISSQFLTTGQSLPKSHLETAFLDMFLGENNMVSLEGERWKTMRSMFNPGFAANHLMTLVPYIVDASMTFHGILQKKAKTNELFEMEEIATRLTIDIIGKVVLDADFDSQRMNHPIVDTFRERAILMPGGDAVFFWQDVQPLRPLRLWLNMRKLNSLIGAELDRKVAARLREDVERADTKKSSKDRKRSVIDLAFDAYQKTNSGTPNDGRMSGDFRRDAIDQMKTFIFAGHDTTSSTIAYIYYFLHLHPAVHTKLIAELDSVFGSSCTSSSIAAQITSTPHIINRLEYTTAVIKETLRIFPPASTLRSGNSAPTPFITTTSPTNPTTTTTYPLEGWQIWPVVSLVHRNPDFFPDPTAFIPERFLPHSTPFPEAKLFTPAGRDAWRPFEKGPRACIGQELALMETKIIVALTVKDFEFTAEVDGKKIDEWKPVETATEYSDGKPGKERGTVEGHRVFQVLKGSAKPKGGMAGRIRFRREEDEGRRKEDI